MVNMAQVATAVPVQSTLVVGRPTVRGKFLYVGKEKFWVRGVSYGTFFVDDDGDERLYRVAKEEDPYALVTYVNYPSTEYMRLPFLDFVAFNVYLESPRAFEDYLARIHSLSDDRPVLLSEIGLDSLRNSEGSQAAMLDWQVRAALRLGCSGVIVFAWTDEWYHGKYPVAGWAFGLTTRDRTPKAALEAVPRAFAGAPVPAAKRR